MLNRMAQWGEEWSRSREEFFLSDDPKRLDRAAIHRFLSQDSYWAQGIPYEVVNRSVESSLCIGLYTSSTTQAGFARFITDSATFAYLCDVFVLPPFRGRGLARWMVESGLAHPRLQGLRRMVLVTRDAHPLYLKLGFTPLSQPEGYMEFWRPNVYALPPDSR